MTTTADVPVPWPPPRKAIDVLAELTIYREPMPAPRPRVAGNRPGIYLPDSYTAERDALKLIMRSALRSQRPANGPVAVEIVWTRTNHRKADIDNLAKLILDAGNGVLYDDDSQVIEASLRIRWGTPGRTELRLLALETEEAFE